MTKPTDEIVKHKIKEMLAAVGDDKTICPSEVARALSNNAWHDLMPQVRECADKLKDDGKLLITQKGKAIESAQAAKGPIRLKGHSG